MTHKHPPEIEHMAVEVLEYSFFNSTAGRAYMPEYQQLVKEEAALSKRREDFYSKYAGEFKNYLYAQMDA